MARIRSVLPANSQAKAAARARHKGTAKKAPQHKVVMEYVTREKKKLITVVRPFFVDIDNIHKCFASSNRVATIADNMGNSDFFQSRTTTRLHFYSSRESEVY